MGEHRVLRAIAATWGTFVKIPNTVEPEPLIIAGAAPNDASSSTNSAIRGWRRATTRSKSFVASASSCVQSVNEVARSSAASGAYDPRDSATHP
jgi:hypothetical protein